MNAQDHLLPTVNALTCYSSPLLNRETSELTKRTTIPWFCETVIIPFSILALVGGSAGFRTESL